MPAMTNECAASGNVGFEAIDPARQNSPPTVFTRQFFEEVYDQLYRKGKCEKQLKAEKYRLDIEPQTCKEPGHRPQTDFEAQGRHQNIL